MRAKTALLASTLLAASLHAQVPTTLNYQGRLLQNTAERDAATGTVDIDFSLWTELEGGTEVWSESWSDGIDSSSNGFTLCGIGFSDNTCRSFRLDTLTGIGLPCANGTDHDVGIICMETDIPR